MPLASRGDARSDVGRVRRLVRFAIVLAGVSAGPANAQSVAEPPPPVAEQAPPVVEQAPPAAAQPPPELERPPAAASPVDSLPPRQPPPDLFPFAGNPVPTHYPEVGLGFGMASYVTDLAPVESAFRRMEDVFRAEGYTIPETTFSLDPLVLATLTVRVSEVLDVALQVARPGSEGDEVRLTGGYATGHLLATEDGRFSLFAGLGGGSYDFTFLRTYGSRVSPVDSTGGHFFLDTITLEGGGSYWTAGGGGTFRAGKLALDALVQYVGMGTETAVTPRAGAISMDLSGVLIGGRFTLFI